MFSPKKLPVVSGNNFLGGTAILPMRKLTQGKIAWIIDAMERGDRSVYSIAKHAGVSPQWVRVMWRRSGYGLEVPMLRKTGRPGKEVTDEDKSFIVECERRHRLNPIALERKIESAYGRHIPHNRLWAVLKEAKMVSNTPAKQSRRKAWVRFERRHSNSLWQMDFSEMRRGDWLLVIIDDASRLVPGHARAENPTAKLAWDTFLAAGERYGFPRQVLTDHGTQFTKEQYDAEGYFDRKLAELRPNEPNVDFLAKVLSANSKEVQAKGEKKNITFGFIGALGVTPST